jgi:hypothetical protein
MHKRDEHHSFINIDEKDGCGAGGLRGSAPQPATGSSFMAFNHHGGDSRGLPCRSRIASLSGPFPVGGYPRPDNPTRAVVLRSGSFAITSLEVCWNKTWVALETLQDLYPVNQRTGKGITAPPLHGFRGKAVGLLRSRRRPVSREVPDRDEIGPVTMRNLCLHDPPAV